MQQILSGRLWEQGETDALGGSRSLFNSKRGEFLAPDASPELTDAASVLAFALLEVRGAELARFDARLEGLADRPRDAVAALAKGLVSKLLHRPTITLKEHAGTATGSRLADAMRQLYDLDDPVEP